MKLWAVIPIKPLRRGKSRLADVLTVDERAKLNKNLLIHTLETLSDIPELERILVVSRDTKALTLARKYGAKTIQEDGTPHLNVALNRAVAIATSVTNPGILVLPADLPLLKKEDISAMIKKASDSPVMVISPDHQKRGTNALLLNPVGDFIYDFGSNSYERHIEQAEGLGYKVEICEITSVAMDLDLPEDLEFLNGEVKNWLVNVDEDSPTVSSDYYERMT
ncbi:MAG: 2-phospho-L-lactate guanylyltransferase [Chloroflexi bacterium]|jgi:2-phospho-L-lactate/phosphoenolpyruvate guanylyltransferase|nr:2-phospho-L-lactate guanylyltransferase [Chloroflexota bacterium]MBT3670751.1 2-phospho-L-lactate guanylyltransferase [Chloroflexota bacterium]MBT4004124.1 2-phospho-L-lactate guanylyltransferase [Chloroflexota bacterium]MBT4305119.1 2-phospho-L-lactate guanylyltransferase [Chloroflexota bacterium]MBT4533359.1 2-phospho-L-lactate guanylyltransferase [Chloroflexota bacterium]